MTTHATEKPLPRSVDLRPNFKKWNIPCRPQGARGTCSVFTVVGALEYALAKEQGKGAALSIEFLNWAGHKATNRDADGGFFSELWKGYEAHGVCLEEELGYQKTFNGALQPENAVLESAKSRKSAAIQLNWLKEWNPNTGLEETAFLEIKRTLSRRFPVCGGFRWPKKAEWHQYLRQKLVVCNKN